MLKVGDSISTTTTCSSHCRLPKMYRCRQCAAECGGRLPVAFFLTILNPFHSIWETPAVVSRSLSPHTTATAKPQQRISPTLSYSLPVLVSCDTVSSFFSLLLTLPVSAGVLAASRERHTRGVRSKHRLLPQMLRGEW